MVSAGTGTDELKPQRPNKNTRDRDVGRWLAANVLEDQAIQSSRWVSPSVILTEERIDDLRRDVKIPFGLGSHFRLHGLPQCRTISRCKRTTEDGNRRGGGGCHHKRRTGVY